MAFQYSTHDIRSILTGSPGTPRRRLCIMQKDRRWAMTRTPPSDPLIAPWYRRLALHKEVQARRLPKATLSAPFGVFISPLIESRFQRGARVQGGRRCGASVKRPNSRAPFFLRPVYFGLLFRQVPPRRSSAHAPPPPGIETGGLSVGEKEQWQPAQETASSWRRSGPTSACLGDQGVLILRSKSIDADHDDRPLIHA